MTRKPPAAEAEARAARAAVDEGWAEQKPFDASFGHEHWVKWATVMEAMRVFPVHPGQADALHHVDRAERAVASVARHLEPAAGCCSASPRGCTRSRRERGVCSGILASMSTAYTSGC